PSGMTPPAGTAIKRLLSVSQTEYCLSADCAGVDGKPVDTVSASNAKSKTDLATLFISTPPDVSRRSLRRSWSARCEVSPPMNDVSVRHVLAGPQRVPDFEELLRGRLAQRIRGEQMLL